MINVFQKENELQTASLDASHAAKALEDEIEKFEKKKLQDIKVGSHQFYLITQEVMEITLFKYRQCITFILNDKATFQWSSVLRNEWRPTCFIYNFIVLSHKKQCVLVSLTECRVNTCIDTHSQ